MILNTRKTIKRKYDLKPYGHFNIKIVKREMSVRTIRVINLDIIGADKMPLTPVQEKKFIKEMKKYKTDVFTDGTKYYTLFGGGIVRINHYKLDEYKYNEGFRIQVDNI